MSETRTWYLIYTKPKQEKVALENLHVQAYEAYLPLITLKKRVKTKIQRGLEPMFPRYLFVHLSTETDNWGPIRSTKGVSHMVKFGDVHAKVPGDFIRFLQEQEQEQELHLQRKETQEPYLKPGDTVSITSGAFAGYEAVFECEKPGDRAIVLLNIATSFTKLNVSQNMLDKSKA